MHINLSDEEAERAAKALPYLIEHGQPTNFDERVKLFTSNTCANCGSNEWRIDKDGFLVCPCVVASREKNEQASPEQKPQKIEPPPVKNNKNAWDEYTYAVRSRPKSRM